MYLVSYDIESDRLRKKISDTLENYGIRIQYSVFECEISEQRYKKMYRELMLLMEQFEDNGNIRFYYICKNCEPKSRVIGDSRKKDTRFQRDDVIII